jgi:integrase
MLKLSRRTKAGAYYIRGTVARQSVFESTGMHNRAAAEAVMQRRLGELIDTAARGRPALTFAQAALTYLETGGEARFLGAIIRHFGPDTLLDHIDNAAIASATRAIYPHASPATINRQLITPISAVVNMAADEGQTPHRKFRRLKGDVARTRWITPEEAERLLAAASPHLKPILLTLIGSGARVSECLTIQAPFYYPATGEIWLPDTKNGHPRMIRLPRRSIDGLTAADLPDRGEIFRTPKGAPYVVTGQSGGQIAGAFAKAAKAAGIGRDVTPHTLRHTWATWYYAQTKDFGGLLDLGGWRKSDMAQRYRKIAPADLADRLAAHGWHFNPADQPDRNDWPALSIVR